LAGAILLRAAFEPRRLLDWAAQARSLGARVGAEIALIGQPGHGVLQISIEAGDERRAVREMVLPLRQALEAQGGSLVVEHASAAMKSHCEAWGSIDPEILGIMKRIKTEFDPGDVLSPGRFVGGL
jgi:glycolate oxidase FAD binding subunit